MGNDKRLIIDVPANCTLNWGPASEVALTRRARDIFEAGGASCTYRIDGKPVALGSTSLRVAPDEGGDSPETRDEVPSVRDHVEVRRLPPKPPPRPPEPDNFVKSSFRVTEMQHECIARTLEVTQKTHELISELNNSFANERLALFKVKQHEGSSREPSVTDVIAGVGRALFDYLGKRKEK
ncbi:MAG: hypothetical protein ACPG4T_05565 [Nannocystaceae bacterium]